MASGRPRGRVGRPARIDRVAIADAVLELGLDGISMKAVADHLGVSVQGLYHHVRNRRELLVLAAERSISRVPAPEDCGQHWDEWLREWARHVYLSFVEEPEVLSQYLTGALRWESMVSVVDSVIQVLGRAGFDPLDAMDAFNTVARYAVGAAAHELRDRGAAAEGRSTMVELHRMVATRPPEELAGVRALLAVSPINVGTRFEDQLTTVLVGIAARRGEDGRSIMDRAASGAPPQRARRIHCHGGGNSHRLTLALEPAQRRGVHSQARGVHGDREIAVAADGAREEEHALLAVDLPFGEAGQRLLDGDPAFEAGQRGTEAEVDAVAEGEVLVEAAGGCRSGPPRGTRARPGRRSRSAAGPSSRPGSSVP